MAEIEPKIKSKQQFSLKAISVGKITAITGILFIIFAILTIMTASLGLADIDTDADSGITFQDIQNVINLYDPAHVYGGGFLQFVYNSEFDVYYIFENREAIAWVSSRDMPTIATPNQFILALNQFIPQGFTFLPAARANVLPHEVLSQFFIFMLLLAAYRLVTGILCILLRKKNDKGALLGLLGKIDLWLIILTTVFTVFFIDGFVFIWFPILSFIPAMLLLHSSSRLDNRPGGADRRESRTAKIFLIPAWLGLAFITYIPLAAVFGISLFEWNFPFPLEFIGLRNYTRVLADTAFWNSVSVTITYALLTVVMGMVYSMIIAMLLNRKIPGRAFFRTVFYLPFIIPAVSSFMVFRLMYNPHFGFINRLITMFGGERVNFLYNNATIIPALAVIAVWTSGNIIVIKMAGLNNVPRTYLEAAEIDGANAWHRFRKITIPVMSPIIFYNMLMSLITHMQVVIPSLMMAGGGTGGTGVIFPAYRFVTFELYARGIQQTNFGQGSTISFLLFCLVGIFTAILFATSKSWLFYEGGEPK